MIEASRLRVGHAGEDALGRATVAHKLMILDIAHGDLQLGGQEATVEVDARAQGGLAEKLQVGLGIVIVDRRAAPGGVANERARLALRSGAMHAAGDNDGDGIAQEAGRGQLVKHGGQQLRGRDGTGHIVNEDGGAARGLCELAQRRRVQRLPQRPSRCCREVVEVRQRARLVNAYQLPAGDANGGGPWAVA